MYAYKFIHNVLNCVGFFYLQAKMYIKLIFQYSSLLGFSSWNVIYQIMLISEFHVIDVYHLR